jgi:hypothetical protein
MLTPDTFASAMADRLREILPDGINVWADGPRIWFGQDVPESGTSVDLAGFGDAERHLDAVVIVANNLLNHGQDYVVECIRERWPPFTAADGGIGMAHYHARLDGNVLRMGYYGVEDVPVLELRPLMIDVAGTVPGDADADA